KAHEAAVDDLAIQPARNQDRDHPYTDRDGEGQRDAPPDHATTLALAFARQTKPMQANGQAELKGPMTDHAGSARSGKAKLKQPRVEQRIDDHQQKKEPKPKRERRPRLMLREVLAGAMK